MTDRLATAFGAAVLLTTTALQAQTPSAMNAEQGWSAVGQCATVANERARHSCLDDLLRKAGLLTPQVEAKERRQQFGLGAAPSVASTPPTPAAPPAPAAAPAAAPSTPTRAAAAPAPAPPPVAQAGDRLEATLVGAVEGNDHKIVLTTTDGAVWKQTDSETVPRLPHAGDVVKIRKGSLGSYLCTMPTNHTFRCIRTK